MYIIVAFSKHKYQFYNRCLEIKCVLLIGLYINMNNIVVFYTVYILRFAIPVCFLVELKGHKKGRRLNDIRERRQPTL